MRLHRGPWSHHALIVGAGCTPPPAAAGRREDESTPACLPSSPLARATERKRQRERLAAVTRRSLREEPCFTDTGLRVIDGDLEPHFQGWRTLPTGPEPHLATPDWPEKVRELQSLVRALDELSQGNVKVVADLLAQRFKALELEINGRGDLASEVDLTALEDQTLTSAAEMEAARKGRAAKLKILNH